MSATAAANLAAPIAAQAALTPSQSAVLRLAAQGLSNARIAELLRRTKEGVESEMHRIYLRLGLNGSTDHDRRVSAVLWWLTRD